ncbi:MAG: glycoside hydrolase family 127 protein [Kiritimatiellae bacterium]|nr:glycoside hydrolase family 127 protein [Kiritimatiellia bacterium]
MNPSVPGLLASLLLAGAAAAQNPREVPLRITNHSPVSRTGVLVRGGVPFARGILKECRQARLLGAKGQDLPCCVRPIARWYDGSVKWVLVETIADVPGQGRLQLRLRPGQKPPDAGNPLRAEENDESIAVLTGPARFEFSKKALGLPSAVWIRTPGDGQKGRQVLSGPTGFTCEIEHEPPGPPQEENWLRASAGGPTETFSAEPGGDYSATLEHVSALQAVVRMSGWLVNDKGRRLIQFIIRAYATAGRSDLRLLVSFVYAGDAKQDFIRTLSLHWPRKAEGPPRWAFGGEKRHEGTLPPNASVSLTEIGPDKFYHLVPYTHDKAVHYTIATGGNEMARGTAAAGWAQLADANSSLAFAMRNFWQMHPKQLTLGPAGLTVYLWPEQGNKVLDLRRRSDEVDDKYHYDLGMWRYGGHGVGVSHEMMLGFGPPAQDNAEAMCTRLNAPLLLECAPEYYAQTGAFGPVAAADPARFPRMEGFGTVFVEWLRQNQRAFHWDGMLDYGDNMFWGYEAKTHAGESAPKSWGSRGYVGWMNNEEVFTHALFMWYLHTGDYHTFLTFEDRVRHVMEVDTCHHCDAEPGYVGGGHRHDQQHWGNYLTGYGTATHGGIDYYLLTGDERALEIALENARYHMSPKQGENEDRIGGLIRLWEITGNPTFKTWADKWLQHELNVKADAGWRFKTKPHFRFISNTLVSLAFYLYSAPPEDTVLLRRAILQSCDVMEADVMSLSGELQYKPLILSSLAYQLTGERKYLLMSAAMLKKVGAHNRPMPPDDLRERLRGHAFEKMVGYARGWGVSNMLGPNINGMGPFPYVIAALKKGGMDEKTALSLPLRNDPVAPFEEVIAPSRIGKRPNGFCYTATLKHGAPCDKNAKSKLILLEDGKPLGPAHAAHAEIRAKGMGRYSHWGARTVYFSASDNSDPHTNGREYKAVLRH